MIKTYRLHILGAAGLAALVAACSTGAGGQDDKSQDAVNVTDTVAEEEVYADLAAPEPLVMLEAAPAMAGGAMAKMAKPMPMPPVQPMPGDMDRDQYEDVEINPVKLVSEEPVSTFSIDVDTASYANVRSFLDDGVLPPKDAVRLEELINYFDYAYPQPRTKEIPFATHVTMVPSPWADERQLIHIGVQGYDMDRTATPPLNLTLLVDVSGSMESENKLPLAKKALKMLVDQMDADDHISIVVYAGAAGAVLEPTSGDDEAKIFAALDNLSAGGSTAGGEGLRLAYSLAEQNFDEDAVNRVILLTDGDFNVGVTSDERLEDFVSRKRDSGVYLSVLGFGRGNYNDAMMQKISQAGNGMASYIDTLNEARKVLADDLAGSMFPIANDVKVQIEFNPARVKEYRLIGYETRMLNREDFNNDQVDAGDIGAGHSVTAIYEITPVGAQGMIDDSRYSQTPTKESTSNEFAFLKLRYKLPGAEASRLVAQPVTETVQKDSMDAAPQYVRFATAVAAFGQMLRGDPYLSDGFGYDEIIDLANSAKGDDEFGYRAEFVQLVRAAKTASAQEALESDVSFGD